MVLIATDWSFFYQGGIGVASTILVGTEIGLIHRLARENPGKRFIPVTEQAICPNMKKIDLHDVYRALEHLQYRITVPEAIRVRAETAVQRMVAVTA